MSKLRIIAYRYHLNTHLVGIEILAGCEPEVGMTYCVSGSDEFWSVSGNGTMSGKSFVDGKRAIVLLPDLPDQKLMEEMILEKVD
ncbi:MAG: hypothetical protein ACO1N0_07925 [Fluviicola sp.]